MKTMTKVCKRTEFDNVYSKLMGRCKQFMSGQEVDLEEMGKMLDLVGRYREQYGYQVPEFELPYLIVHGKIERGDLK
ncbi:MAG: hypothetical protein GX957_16390 [Clostridiaceae bacterium]|nr:hypothetical protein [Clostridiaceae bacterium]